MRWDYPLLNIKPVFPGLREIIITFIIKKIIIIIIIITFILLQEKGFTESLLN